MAFRAGVHVVSASEIAMFLRCAREWYFSYGLRRTRRAQPREALTRGKAIHVALGCYHRKEPIDYDLLRPEDRALLRGYVAYWRNPETGLDRMLDMEKTDVPFQISVEGIQVIGEFDGIGTNRQTGKRVVAEHKCLAGDTRILNHDSMMYERMDVMAKSGTSPLVTCMTKDGRFVTARASKPRAVGSRVTFRVQTVNGREIVASENHPIWTHRGWVHASHLLPDDWLATSGMIPIRRSAINIGAAVSSISSSKLGGDARMQPEINEKIWWDRVESVVRGPEEVLYDLSVPEHHTFVANGIVTHNSSSEDISVGSAYWQKVALTDRQVSLYLMAAEQKGWGQTEILYDVLFKPRLRLSKNESPEAFEHRVLRDIAEAPERYYQRGTIVRLEHEHVAHRKDLRGIVHLMEAARAMGPDVPRNVDSCFKYGAPCEFIAVCGGGADIMDDTLFEPKVSSRRRQESAVEENPYVF
jgi:hypothetical protein